MPWDCCGDTLMDSTGTCPACGKTKAAWTVELEKTRTLVIERKKPKKKKIELFTGEDDAHCEDDTGQEPVHPLEKAELAPAIALEIAEEYAGYDTLPPAQFFLTIRVSPADERDATIKLTFTFADDSTQDLELPPPEEWDGDNWDATFLLVYGRGNTTELQFPGVTVLDITSPEDEDDADEDVDEASPHAIGLTVSGLELEEQKLQVVALLPALDLDEEEEEDAEGATTSSGAT